jgi:PAS domain S-box-containing protein
MSETLPNISGHKVMVVDDNPASLYATSRVLRASGFHTVEAVSGAQALAAADTDVALIVLDVNLPDMDGFEVCRQLRARSHTAFLPIVHLSATVASEIGVSQGLAAGADGYLTHPIEPAALVATVRALLVARQADAVRRVSDARFRTVFELAASGIAVLDADLIYRDVNPAFCALTGRERSALIGNQAGGLIAPGHESEVESARACLQREGMWEGRLPVLRPDGGLAEVEWRVMREPATGAIISIANDITERQRSEAERERLLASERAARSEAERSNRLKDEFLATLSHELRNPLNAILGWARVLSRTPGTPEVMLQGLEAIERNSRVQSHLIADLLDFAGIRFGKMRLDLEVVDPAQVVRAAVDVVEAQAHAKGVHLECDIAATPPARILGDEARLQQVVWNLLSNAIKFTPKSGHVTVHAGVAGDRYEITVKDTGRGISREFLPQIFERFSQQDSGAAKSFAGLGIGLTIVKHFVEMHSGTIEAESAGEGQGATFRVRLPLTQKQQVAATLLTTAATPLERLEILVVEDDTDARDLIVRILSDAGARVRQAADADQALAQIGEAMPQVLVSDIGMASKDGYQLLRTLRASGYTPERLPAVALTAFSREQDRSDALQAGFQGHLVKPVNADTLISVVARLARSRAAD